MRRNRSRAQAPTLCHWGEEAQAYATLPKRRRPRLPGSCERGSCAFSGRISALLLASVLLILGLGVASCARQEQPDVVLIVIDTLRPDHLGFLGYRRETAPYLADLAARSLVFENAYSASTWTGPATASLHLGRYPTEHGVIENFFAHSQRARQIEATGSALLPLNRLPDSLPTLAQRMNLAGFATLGFSANINIGDEIGFDRGFDHFEHLSDADAATLVRAVRAQESTLGKRPYFLYLHFNDVHSPYHARPPWYVHAPDFRKQQISAYDSEISYLDMHLRRLSQELGWEEETVIIVVSDHGEEFGEHGRTGHNFSLHDELMRILLLIHAPRLEAARISNLASIVDVAPTLLELLGLEPSPGMSGISLLEGAADAVYAHRQEIGADREHHLWAVVEGSWKAIQADESMALYDLAQGREERIDLAASQPEVTQRLAERLQGFRRDAFTIENPRIEVELDRETLESLRTLGYVD